MWPDRPTTTLSAQFRPWTGISGGSTGSAIMKDRQTGTARFTTQGEGDKGQQGPQNSFEKIGNGAAATSPKKMRAILILSAIGIGIIGLWLTGRVSYLLFHSLAELFSVLVAWGMFIVAWNSRRFVAHSFFLFLGVAFLAVGALDLLHMLSYKGMGVFPGATADLVDPNVDCRSRPWRP